MVAFASSFDSAILCARAASALSVLFQSKNRGVCRPDLRIYEPCKLAMV